MQDTKTVADSHRQFVPTTLTAAAVAGNAAMLATQQAARCGSLPSRVADRQRYH